MSEITTRAEEGAKLYVLMKRGLYWRPDAQGYTGVLADAGRYTAEKAAAYTRHDDPSVKAILASEADEFSPACWEETKLAVRDKQLVAAESRAASAEAEVERLTKEKSEALAMSDSHREQLQDALDEIGRLSDPLLRDMRLENGEINMNVAGPIVERLALAITGWFRESGAENYVEMNLNARDNVDDRYCVTVQRVFKQSPHQLREAAEASASALRDRVAVLESALKEVAACPLGYDDGTQSYNVTELFRMVKAIATAALNGGDHV